MRTYNQHVFTQERRNVMIIILDDIGGSKGRDGARARARTRTPTLFLGHTEARRAEKSRISLSKPDLPLIFESGSKQ